MRPRRQLLAGVFCALALVATGCDSERSDDEDAGASATTIDDEDEDDVTKDDDGDAPPHADPPAHLRAPGPGDEPYCGDGNVDADEDCDDAQDNGPDRECTRFCTLNDCDLDEEGDCLAAP